MPQPSPATQQRPDERDAELQRLRAELAHARLERDIVLNSTLWRAAKPLRLAGKAVPSGMRKWLRRLVRRNVLHIAGSAAPGEEEDPDEGRHIVTQSAYDAWILNCDTLTDEDRTLIAEHIAAMREQPLISIVMPAYDTPEPLLRAAIDSITKQLYPNWELCVVDDASPSSHVAQTLQAAAAGDARIKFLRRDVNGNISAATNTALSLATGHFVALMDHDDLLAEHAIYEIAAELEIHPDADLIYSDEDHIDARGRRHSPYFKPDWNVDLMLGHNLVNHLCVFRRSLVEAVGGMRVGLEGSQDYDLALRIAAATKPNRIRHIPAVLYHWRVLETSFSQSRHDICAAAARRAIGDFLDMAGMRAEVMAAPDTPGWTRIRWLLPDPPPRVSLIMPTRNHADLLRRSTEGILNRTEYADFELIIVDNDSDEPATLEVLKRLQHDSRVRILKAPGAFNYSAINNAASATATGSVLVLINNDIDVIHKDWLCEMVSHANRSDVGAVGARLLFPDDTIQHAGVVLGVGTFAGGPGVAGHFGLHSAAGDIGYFGQSALTREVSAVTGACLAMRKCVYDAVGGLDADALPIAFNDVDLCMRIRERGLQIVYTPFATLYHLESASRGTDLVGEKAKRFHRECLRMRARWGSKLDTDPFYNINFSRYDSTFRLAVPSPRIRPWLRSTETDAAQADDIVDG